MFLVDCQDNDSYAFRAYPRLTEYQRIHQSILPDTSGAPRAGVSRCAACGELLDKWNEPLTGLVIKKRKYDISGTYDGITVVSQRFQAVYREAEMTGLTFQPLPDDPDFFAIQATRSVGFDAEKGKTRFIKPCPVCGRYESVVGIAYFALKPGSDVDAKEFVRSDLEFASEDEKHPLLLCGVVAGQILKAAKLKGLDLIPIEDPA